MCWATCIVVAAVQSRTPGHNPCKGIMNRWLILTAAISIFAAPETIGNFAARAQPDGVSGRRYTKDRLSEAQMAELVAGPMALVRDGRVGDAERAFEGIVQAAARRHGNGSVEVADRLTAFGVLIYIEGLNSGDVEMRRLSLPYLQRAVEAYRAAFGPSHPEVAVALNSYADVQTALNSDDPPPSAEAALEEAYDIRLSSLGPSNPETLASLLGLAEIRSAPSRTRGDPARIAAAAAMFRGGIPYARGGSGQAREEMPATWYFGLARLYARHRQLSNALGIVEEAERDLQGDAHCVAFVTGAMGFAELLANEGYEEQAQALRMRYSFERLLSCPDSDDTESLARMPVAGSLRARWRRS